MFSVAQQEGESPVVTTSQSGWREEAKLVASKVNAVGPTS